MHARQSAMFIRMYRHQHLTTPTFHNANTETVRGQFIQGTGARFFATQILQN